jgi:hypothetical protein
MICPFCKETILDGAIKCRYCGSMLNGSPASDAATEDLRTFVGPNSHYYTQQFSKFTQLGAEKFVVTWNWSCFGFTFLWMLYRKMYVQSLITFIVFCIPGLNVILHVLVGIVGNYLYYRHVKDKLHEVQTAQQSQNIAAVIQEVGGVHKWVVTLGIIAAILVTILMALFFSTMIAYMGQHISTISL